MISPHDPHYATGDPINVTDEETYSFGRSPDITMREIVGQRETNPKFGMTTLLDMAYAVGAGYHLDADTDKSVGVDALDFCKRFADRWNLDELNQKISIDVWSSGNAFIEPLRDGDKLAGLSMLPLSSFRAIRRDRHGDIVSFLQEWGSDIKTLEPMAVMHFSWLARDASAWGTGLGQPLARKGYGYSTKSGRRRRPSLLEIDEMMTDVTTRMVYWGLPRFDVGVKGNDNQTTRSISNAYNNLEPLQHMVHNFDTDIKTISLDTQGRFDSFIRHVDDQVTTGTMNPIIRLWSSMNYTYASAKEARNALMPFIGMNQRAHKRFIENMVLKPLVAQEFGMESVELADVRLNWGAPQKMTIDDIVKIDSVLSKPQYADRYNPDDIVRMFREAGADLTAPETPTDTPDMPGEPAVTEDQVRALRAGVLRQILERGGK